MKFAIHCIHCAMLDFTYFIRNKGNPKTILLRHKVAYCTAKGKISHAVQIHKIVLTAQSAQCRILDL